MKKVMLKVVTVPGQPEPLVYSEHIIQMLQRPKSVGPMGVPVTTAAEMRISVPILEKVEVAVVNGQTYVLLEDAEFKDLCERAENHTFAMNHRVLSDMVDDIIGSDDYLVEVPKEG